LFAAEEVRLGGATSRSPYDHVPQVGAPQIALRSLDRCSRLWNGDMQCGGGRTPGRQNYPHRSHGGAGGHRRPDPLFGLRAGQRHHRASHRRRRRRRSRHILLRGGEMDAFKVIDADGHAMDYEEIYNDYLEEPYVRHGRGAGGPCYPMEAYYRSMYGPQEALRSVGGGQAQDPVRQRTPLLPSAGQYLARAFGGKVQLARQFDSMDLAPANFIQRPLHSS
jgi:hypothetical protein